MKFFALVTQHSQKEVQIEGWGRVGGKGWGLGVGALSKQWESIETQFLFIYLISLGNESINSAGDHLQFGWYRLI